MLITSRVIVSNLDISFLGISEDFKRFLDQIGNRDKRSRLEGVNLCPFSQSAHEFCHSDLDGFCCFFDRDDRIRTNWNDVDLAIRSSNSFEITIERIRSFRHWIKPSSLHYPLRISLWIINITNYFQREP
uniref:Uncharacterized protein n=1 Tax=Rhizobium phage LG08 TaxID=3129229 RepID=A0AAU8HXU1_9CAUD